MQSKIIIGALIKHIFREQAFFSFKIFFFFFFGFQCVLKPLYSNLNFDLFKCSFLRAPCTHSDVSSRCVSQEGRGLQDVGISLLSSLSHLTHSLYSQLSERCLSTLFFHSLIMGVLVQSTTTFHPFHPFQVRVPVFDTDNTSCFHPKWDRKLKI